MNSVLVKYVVGTTINGRWRVLRPRSGPPLATGGQFSECFYAKGQDGKAVFIKFLDIRLVAAASDPLADLQLRLERFNYERGIALRCAERRLSRVSHAIDHGFFDCVDTGTQYPFLVFDQADGDLREQVERSRALPAWVCFGVLHNVAAAIRQLHGIDVAHQDIKPSNVLEHGADGHKLADFGSAHDRRVPRPGPLLRIAGDPTYAPPEQLFNYAVDDWSSRRLMADVYHLGSLALFLFTGSGATDHLGRSLDPSHHWDVWVGDPRDLLIYIRRATDTTVQGLTREVTGLPVELHSEFLQLLRYLLEPDVTLRGHPADRAEMVPYGMQRFISRFHVCSETANRLAQRPVRAA